MTWNEPSQHQKGPPDLDEIVSSWKRKIKAKLKRKKVVPSTKKTARSTYSPNDNASSKPTESPSPTSREGSPPREKEDKKTVPCVDLSLKQKTSRSFSYLGKILIWCIVSISLLWNWDGFWQTNIEPLTKFQQTYFKAKYKDEQNKLSRITRNNRAIEDIEQRLERYRARADRQIEEAREEVLTQRLAKKKARAKLKQYLDQENDKCSYYNASLIMIEQLTSQYSKDELRRKISCTNHECKDILNSKPAALTICD
jgi:hypothetical protein